MPPKLDAVFVDELLILQPFWELPKCNSATPTLAIKYGKGTMVGFIYTFWYSLSSASSILEERL
jgi:hypothetical protein